MRRDDSSGDRALAEASDSEAAPGSPPARPPWLNWQRWLRPALVAALLVAAAGALGLALVDHEQLHRLIVRAGSDPEDTTIAASAVAGIQQRALWAAMAYTALAALVIGFWGRVRRLPRRAMAGSAASGGPISPSEARRAQLDWALVAVMTAVSAGLAAAHMSQTLRLDEVSTFFNFGLRSPVAALVMYHNVNNHILHSLLMLGSVSVLGEAEWAIRLPAMLAGVASVPMMYVVGRRHFDRATGLIAAGAMAGSAYLVELATNARGYSMVNLAALVAFAALPGMLRYRAGPWMAFVIASALGAWATPTMLYPFAAAGVWLGLAGLDGRWPLLARIDWWRDVAIAVAATGALVLLLYSPALVITGYGDMGTTTVAQKAARLSEGQRASQLLEQVVRAWEQWTYPASRGAALVTLGLVVAGWIVAVIRGGASRWLALGAVAGPAAVVLVMGGVTPWWWSLGYLFLLYVLLGAAALGAAVMWLSRNGLSWPAPAGAAAAVVVGGVSLTLWSEYPDDFPHYHGYRDAPLAAAIIDAKGPRDLHFAGAGMTRIPIEYYLYRRGYPQRVLEPLSDEVEPGTVVAVVRHGIDDPPVFDGLMRSGEHQLPRSTLLFYEPAASPGGSEAGAPSRRKDEAQ